MMIGKRIFLTLSFLFIYVQLTNGQELLMGPSTSTIDSKSIFANPALISFQPSHFSLGVKTYHTGFFDDSNFNYRQGFFSLNIPRFRGSRFGGGINVQYFDSPIFKRSQSGGSFSVALFNRVSLGINASLYHVGYNTSNFVDFDFNDPVFDDGYNRFTLNTRAGLYARPFSNIEVAVGAHNINEPDISISGSGANKPMEIFSALSVNYGVLRGTFELVQKPDGIENRSHLELFSSRGYFARFGSDLNFNSSYVEAQAHLYGGFSAGYQFELPINELAGNSSGSHMVSIYYEFNRVPSVPDQRTMPDIYPDPRRPRTPADIPPIVLFNTDTDHVTITNINLTRVVDQTSIDENDLASLSVYDLGTLDLLSGIGHVPYEQRTPTSEFIPESAELSVSVSDRYEQTLDFLHDILSEEAFEELNILINEGEGLRAAGIRNRLQEGNATAVPVYEHILSSERDSSLYKSPLDISLLDGSEEVAIANPNKALIEPVYTATTFNNWDLNIYDEDNNLIRQISGNGEVPEVIEWEWTDNNDNLIDPGLYNYYLQWTDLDGITHESRSRKLFVQEVNREIRIDITKDIERIISDPDSMDIILKNN